MKYLENEICEFEINFEINMEKKVNIISCIFFKMEKHYKNFNKYIDGIKKLVEYIDRTRTSYILRIFIDENIKKDKNIMKILESSKKVQLVVFKCKNYMDEKKIYHKDLFGTLIRLFPIFDFKNNDTNKVLVMDIELQEEVIKQVKYIIEKDIEIETEMIIKITLQNYYTEKEQYALAGLIFVEKKYDRNIIMNFIKNIKSDKDSGHYKKRKTDFGFGVDEIFLNKYFITKYIKKITVINKYNLNWFLYYFREYLEEKYPNRTKNILTKVLNKKLSIKDKFEYIDKLFYNIEDTKIITEEIKNITKNYYIEINKLMENRTLWYTKEVIEIINKYYKNIISCITLIDLDIKKNRIINIKNKNIIKIE